MANGHDIAYWRQRAAFYARRSGVPVDLFLRQINQESGFNPGAHSGAGAQGIAQIVPRYHPGVNVNDPEASLAWAAHEDAQNFSKYRNWKDVLSIYNSGRLWNQGKGISETRNYVNSILGGANLTPSVPAKGSRNAPTATGGLGGTSSLPNFQNVLAASLMDAASKGGQLDPHALLSLALMRQSMGAAAQANGPVGTESVSQLGSPASKRVKFLGDLSGVNQGFVNSVSSAVAAVGGTQVRVSSGYRSPAHNKNVGGVSNSNHTYGHAMDATVFIPGKGWVPLGTALRGVAKGHGLRSGDQPGFYNGQPDPNHVDDGWNLTHHR